MEIKLSNGKDHVYQWDADITISVPADVTEVHFRYWPTNKPVAAKDGQVEIPPELMWTTDTIRLWTYKPDHTLDEAKIEVHARPRPDGYAYTPTEIKTWGQLEKRIETLEQDGVKGSVTSVNGKQGDVELSATDVGAATADDVATAVDSAWEEVQDALQPLFDGKQPKGDYITRDGLQSATDAVLAQAKASGEFDGTSVNWHGAYSSTAQYSRMDAVSYDGSSYVYAGTVPTIGAVPGIDDEWQLLALKGDVGPSGAGMEIAGATVGQIPVITAVDSNGKPTAWGSADMPGGTDLNAVNVFVADFAHDAITVTSGAVDKYSRVVVS
mgnify:CR=1 FL=1